MLEKLWKDCVMVHGTYKIDRVCYFLAVVFYQVNGLIDTLFDGYFNFREYSIGMAVMMTVYFIIKPRKDPMTIDLALQKIASKFDMRSLLMSSIILLLTSSILYIEQDIQSRLNELHADVHKSSEAR